MENEKQLETEAECLRLEIAQLKAERATLSRHLETLRQSEKWYRGIVEAAQEGVCVIGADERTTFANARMAEMLGCAVEDVIGSPAVDFLDAEGKTRVGEYMRQKRKGAVSQKDFKIRRKDGSNFWALISANSLFDEYGKHTGALALVSDITERRKIEESLRSAQEFLSNLLENAQCAIFVSGVDGRVRLVNSVWESHTGLKRDDIVNRTALEFFPEDIARRFMAEDQTVAESGVPLVLQERVDLPNGAHYLHTVKFPLRDADGNVEAIGGISVDMTEREMAEQALRVSEERTRLLIEHSSDIIAIIGPEGEIQYVGPSVERILGYTPDEALGCSVFTDFMHPDDAKLFFKEFISGDYVDYGIKDEFRMRHKDGSWRYLEGRGSYLWNTPGINGALINAREITERKQFVAQIEETNDTLQVLIDSSPLAITAVDTDANVTMWNAAAERMFGWTFEEVQGKPLPFVPAEDVEDYEARFQASVAGTFVGAAERRRLRKDGSLIDISISAAPLQDNHGHIRGSMAIIADMTEQTQARETMRLLESAVHQATDSVLITDTNLEGSGPRILFVNPAFTRMTGYTATDVLGMTPEILNGPKTELSVLEEMRAQLARGEMFSAETTNYRKDRSVFQMEWYASPVRNSSGEITHFISIQRDITERKHLETQLLQAQKMEGIGRLAGGVAHDFNNLLTAIIGYSELAQMSLPPDTPGVAYLQHVRQAADRAAELTHQLLAFARKQVIEPKVVNLNNLILGVDKMLRRLIGEDIELVTLPDANLGQTKVDPGQFEQILVNLAVNARDAMPGGGKLTIETVNATFDETDVPVYGGLPAGNYVMVAVSDNGAGMSREIQAHIFEPFYTTKDQGKGTGLGLATCYGIVKQSGGHIWVYSEIGIGTTFKICLPRVMETESAQGHREDQGAIPRGTETVMLVEDEPMVRSIAAQTLRGQGYEVIEAGSGAEALVACIEHRAEIHMLLTDVIMPHMSGRELAKRLEPLRPAMKVLYTSGYTDSAIVEHGMLEEGIAFLQKPFTPAGLARKVRSVLDET
jgi:two-component system cell cycle sensor histidine kinase/response regulator CckA